MRGGLRHGRCGSSLIAIASVLFLGASASGCSAAFWNGVAEGLAATRPPVSSPVETTSRAAPYGAGKLMVFGGQGHATYLGCLSCSAYESDSVFNQYGSHGSRYQTESVFNQYGEFGSKYSPTSACNPYATDPPVIVDDGGGFHGRLTVNRYNAQGASAEVLAWIAGVCAGG